MEEHVFILTGNYGEGHQQAAKAVRESLQRHDAKIQVDVLDYMKITHPYAHPLYRSSYLQGVRKLPSIYGYLFERTRETNLFSDALKKMNRFGIGRLAAILGQKRPSVVISTFPLAAGAMSLLKESGLSKVPAVTVITDHTDHSSWVHPFTDHYLVGSDIVKQGLLKRNVPDYRCTVTGIPIRAQFAQEYDRERTARKHDLEPSLQTLLVMGGGYGLMDDGAHLLRDLELLTNRVQIVFVCGHNVKLKQRLERIAVKSKHSIRIFGFVDEIQELMAVADLMVTKPGGLTSSEALAMKLPMVLYKPIPGQEEDNAHFLLQAGVAARAGNSLELAQTITHLLQSPDKLLGMRLQASAVQRKDAADATASIILQTRRHYDSTALGVEALVPLLQN